MTPHLGLVWQQFRATYPLLEEHPPLPPVFETFGPNPEIVPSFTLRLAATPDMPRVLFINKDRTELLQVQKDRFIHNWRKVGDATSYPRFERMLANFQTGYSTFSQTISDVGLGAVVPNQCDVTYINQITVPAGGNLSELTDDLFGQHTGSLVLDDLGSAEDLRFLVRYVMRDHERKPIGRLVVLASPALRADGQKIVQLTLTARGRPSTPDLHGIVDFLNRGRVSIVKGFTRLTGPKMHKLWERTQ